MSKEPSKLLESAPLSRFHYLLLLIGCLVYALTAMNTMLIGATLPAIISEWGLGKVEAGLLISSGLLGMFFGALSCGILADTIGRRATLILTVALMSVCTGLCGLAWDAQSMAFLRFLAGVGLGGALPQPGVYVAEYVPAKHRGKFLGLVESSWAYGALLAVLFPYLLINYGWRTAYSVAFIPLLLIPAILLVLPESIRYLESKGRRDEALEILRRRGLITDGGKAEKPRILELWSRAYWRRTLLLWILWFSLVYTYYGIFAWLPTIYAELKGPAGALYRVLLITLLQIPGYYTATFLLDVVGRKPVLSAYLFMAGVGCGLLAVSSRGQMFLWSCMVSFFNLGAWAGLYTYTPELYPTRMRGTGFGSAASIGRIGGILTPTITGYLLSIAGINLTFLVFALIHIVAAAAVITLGVETRRKTLEEISA
ncbi:MFS transporter [Candidatus Bathyarchaeota archaeon]|nr:MAG: MFS transporter [Candidatus Bathyarchaeota archaeon]